MPLRLSLSAKLSMRMTRIYPLLSILGGIYRRNAGH